MRVTSRWLGLAGVAFVIVAFLGLNSLGDTPSLDEATSSEIIKHWTEVANGDLASALLVLCIPLLVIFGASVLIRYHGSKAFPFDLWSFLFGVGIAMAAVGFAWEASAAAAIADATSSGFSDMVVGLHLGSTRVHMVWTVGLSVALLGAAGMFIPRAGFERVLGWTALVLGVVGLLPEPIGLVGTVVSVLWILVMSITIVATTSRAGHAGGT